MNRLIFKKFLIFVSLMFVFNLAYANLEIAPAVVNINAEPMSVYEGKFVVTNLEDVPVTVKIEKEDWKNSSGNDSFTTVDRWLELPKTVVDIAPKGTVEVPFVVTTDNNMKGSISGMVVFTIEGGMFQISMKQPVYLVIKGTEKLDFKIDELDLKTSTRDGGIYYNLTLKNNGNIHIRHNGVIEIYNKQTGDLVKSVNIDETFPTYAQDSRNFKGFVISGTDLKKGKYVALFKIKAFDKQVIGRKRFKVSRLGEVVTE